MIELKANSRPYFNTNYFPTEGASKYVQTPRTFNIKELMWWVKRTPEAIGIGRRIALDIVSNYTFRAIDKKFVGRPKAGWDKESEDKATRFASNEQLKNKLIELILDWVFTGDSYLWLGQINEDKIKEITDRYSKDYGVEVKEIGMKNIFYDEDHNLLSQLEIVPSTTMEIKHDGQKIFSYTQRVLGKETNYEPSQIIHSKFMSVDGDPYGFTPMMASAGAIKSLGFIKDYTANYFKNGGSPDMIFTLPKEMAGSSNMKLIEQTLEKYKNMKYKHGNMLFAGEVGIEKLNEWNKDMEFRQYAIYLTGNLAFAFNMPPDILSSILGGDIRGTAGGSDIEDTGYNRNIENAQQYWEGLLNSQLFNKYFGVDIIFERTFRQDQIRQAQYRAQNVSLIEFMFKHKYPISDEFVHDMLQIPRKYLTEGKIEREIEEKVEGMSPFTKPPKGKNEEKLSDKKKQEQKPQERNNPPMGV